MSYYMGYTLAKFMFIFIGGVFLCWLAQMFLDNGEIKKPSAYPKLRLFIFFVVFLAVTIASLMEPQNPQVALLANLAALLMSCLIDYLSHQHSQDMGE